MLQETKFPLQFVTGFETEIDFIENAAGNPPVRRYSRDRGEAHAGCAVIDHVAEDEVWCRHATPALYGFQSYISVPIILADGVLFGTLCAVDPRPARRKTPEVIGMFRLFAELIARHLDADRKLVATESALTDERAMAELREQFIAILGHDLRTPMRAITGFSELMLKSPLDADVAEMAAFIRNSAMRMNALIDNMLDLARGRLGGGFSLIRDAGESLEPVLQAVVAELQASHPDRVVQTRFALSEPVSCDRGRIAQLASNLLSNALIYSSSGEPVTVRAVSDAECFELSVSNGGKPIPPAVLAHIFEPFYRSGSRHTREGFGLGLYIASEIAKAHGGTLSVASTEEETRFTFRMPMV